MPKKRFSREQIVVVLRQIGVLMSQGKVARCVVGKPEYPSEAITAAGRKVVVLSSIRPSVSPNHIAAG